VYVKEELGTICKDVVAYFKGLSKQLLERLGKAREKLNRRSPSSGGDPIPDHGCTKQELLLNTKSKNTISQN
jgi:hypothetical protein